jgi:hypothetical protein
MMQVQKGSAIVSVLLIGQSQRLSNIAKKMDGQSASCYMIIKRKGQSDWSSNVGGRFTSSG